MPGLPEVEVVRRGLDAVLPGRTVATVSVLHPRTVRRQPGGSADFVAGLSGRGLGRPARPGKVLWLPLGGGGGLDTQRPGDRRASRCLTKLGKRERGGQHAAKDVKAEHGG